MIRIMSEDETAAWDKRVAELHGSESLVDRIAAILMDLKIGGFGDNEDKAGIKAKEIYDRLWPKLKFKLPEAYMDDDYDEQ
ncbi:MAG: hypothetical protein LN413_00440 [Candidatus Thermoplasmatota archaeon]|nr:hypothetical protein [Candidatus Thermoplasmatota archaeon]